MSSSAEDDGGRPNRSRRTLQRQLRKSGLVDDGAESDGLETFLGMVEETYNEFDRHRQLTDRSTRLASDELAATIASLASSERLFRSLARCSPNGIVYTDAEGSCLYANERAEVLFGYPAEQLTEFQWLSRIEREDRAQFLPFLTAASEGHDTDGTVEHRVMRPDGATMWASTSIAAVEDPAQPETIVGWVAHIEDITERKSYERELSHLARSDSLTQLNNRYSLSEQLGMMCSALTAGDQLAVAVIDLDRFKLVNDTFGHESGDQMLVSVARKLEAAAGKHDLVARLGGDEFAFVTHLDATDDAVQLGRRLSRTIHGPVDCAGRTLHVAGSVGVAVTGPGELTPDDLLRNADTAMYRAKRSSILTSQVFDESFREEVTRRFMLESDVRSAIAGRTIELAYQPIIDAVTQRIIAVEALARLDHPRLGVVPPVEFIAVAEDLGLIAVLGDQLLDQACRQLRAWRDRSPILRHLVISVNTSPLQLTDPEFPNRVRRSLARHGLPPSALLVEITESAIVSHVEQSLWVLDSLRELGVAVAIDDFGTGYSSLSYLDRLPVDYLKIDKSFVQAMGSDRAKESSNRLTETIIELSLRFGMTPIAEGVETELQRRMLIQAGCSLIQGYLFARPMAPDDDRLVELLGLHRSSADRPDTDRVAPDRATRRSARNDVGTTSAVRP